MNGYLKEQYKHLKCDVNLLIITYFDQQHKKEYNKILRVAVNRRFARRGSIHGLNDDGVQPAAIEDMNYPLHLEELENEEEPVDQTLEYESMTQVVTLISRLKISSLANAYYCKCTADFENQEYFKIQNN